MFESGTTIRHIVAEDFRTAAVFQKYGIDFCCGGDRPVAEACRERGIDDRGLIADLEAATATTSDAPRFSAWDLALLMRYIVANHHGYVRGAVETLGAHTRKVADAHGDAHPEVREIARRFQAIADEMVSHMAREERVLFPYIRALEQAQRTGSPRPSAPFATVASPIAMMEAEHESAGQTMLAIRRLSGGYAPPADACTTFTVTYRELEAFEADLHRHVHLENNILFPRALAIEQGMPVR
jgi:regulator of cell morphogenesis and NO signaling